MLHLLNTGQKQMHEQFTAIFGWIQSNPGFLPEMRHGSTTPTQVSNLEPKKMKSIATSSHARMTAMQKLFNKLTI